MDTLLLKPEDAAKALGISRSSLYSMLARGELPVVRLGPQMVRIPADALKAWVAERTTGLDEVKAS